MDRLISLRLDTEMLEGLEAAATARDLKRSELIRKILERYLSTQPSLRAPKT